ncbi:MAG TPA: 2-phospho-L-lactate transferase [Actinomycetes bacterium]|nr:2-phospho-L-lactate transferase [Actinomycetes bacterium]
MRISALAGDVGAARFLRGLVRQLAARDDAFANADVTVIGNTAHDITAFGLRVCPDLDAVMYGLGGRIDDEQGGGRRDDTFAVRDELREYNVPPEWFVLGDQDFATHIVRTQMLRSGWSLSDVTAALCKRWDPQVTLLPMTDDPVETHVIIDDPDADGGRRAVHFQEWSVRMQSAPGVHEFVFLGADQAKPAPGVVESIELADVVLLPPSNPVVGIGAILRVPGVADVLRATVAPVVGVSPIVADSSDPGIVDKCLAAIDVATTAHAIAAHYGSRIAGGLLDGWLVDGADADANVPGIRQRSGSLLMPDDAQSVAIAGAALDLAVDLMS